jgi:hypothetical protein
MWIIDVPDSDDGSGYDNSVVSGENVLVNGGGIFPVTITRTDGSDFDLASFYATSAWHSSQPLKVEGYNNGAILWSQEVTLNNTTPTLVTGEWTPVDQIVISSPGVSSQANVAFDNFLINI